MSTSIQEPPSQYRQHTFVQFGCGLCAPENWLNFDASFSLRLQKLPIMGQLIPSGPFGRFPKNVYFGDIVTGLPIKENSIDLLYCSHVLEHLTVSEVKTALRNCYSNLKIGGIFRMVLPDLEQVAEQYLQSTDSNAAHVFMETSWLGRHNRHNSLVSFLREWLGRSHHLWMWDYQTLSQELEHAGFSNIQRVQFGDSGIPAFTDVEDPERWELALGIQCSKIS